LRSFVHQRSKIKERVFVARVIVTMNMRLAVTLFSFPAFFVRLGNRSVSIHSSASFLPPSLFLSLIVASSTTERFRLSFRS
jgi:hypothetical protein